MEQAWTWKPVSIEQKPNRRRTKLSKITEFLQSLPKGITFTGLESQCNEEFVMRQLREQCPLDKEQAEAMRH